MECPVCRGRSLQTNPPRNLALRNLCEAFTLERAQRALTGSGEVCSRHYEELRLFCEQDQQLVCDSCVHSHRHHSIKSIDEAVRDNKRRLQKLLKPLQEKLDLFNDIRGNFDQTAKDIEIQTEVTGKQIKDVFSMFRHILREEEQRRMTALMNEKQQKSAMIQRKTEALSRDIEALSDTISGTKEVLRAVDLSFLQNYNTAAELVRCFQLNNPQAVRALIDTDKHLKNLHVNILERMKKKVDSTLNPHTAPASPVRGRLRARKRRNPQAANPEPAVLSLAENLAKLRAGERGSYCAPHSGAFMSPSSPFSAPINYSAWSSVSSNQSNTRISYARPDVLSRQSLYKQ